METRLGCKFNSCSFIPIYHGVYSYRIVGYIYRLRNFLDDPGELIIILLCGFFAIMSVLMIIDCIKLYPLTFKNKDLKTGLVVDMEGDISAEDEI